MNVNEIPFGYPIHTLTQVDQVPNPNYKIKKTRTRTWHVYKNSTRFYSKNETKLKQGCDKKTYSKLVLNKLKVIQGLTFIIPLRELKEVSIEHLSPCVTCDYLCVAHDWTKSELTIN